MEEMPIPIQNGNGNVGPTSVRPPRAYELKDNLLYQVCRPFLVLMRLGGMYFIPSGNLRNLRKVAAIDTPRGSVFSVSNPNGVAPESDLIVNEKLIAKYSLFENICAFYCCVVFIFILIFCGKFIYTAWYFIHHVLHNEVNNNSLAHVVNAVSYTLWIVQLLIIHVVILTSCWKKSSLFRLFLSFDLMHYRGCTDPNCNMANFAGKAVRRRNIIGFICVLHLALQIYTLWGPILIESPLYAKMRENFLTGSVPNTVVFFKVVMIVGSFYASFLYVVPTYFFVMISSFFIVDFMHIHHDFKQSIGPDGSCSKLEWFRTSHNTMCMLLEVADDVLSPFILISLFCAVFQVLMGIFVLVNLARMDQLETIMMFSMIFWCLQYFAQLGMILFTGASIRTAAHSPTIYLHQIDQAKLSVPETLQLQTFINQLSCNNIGFTAWKMFKVDHGAIVTLFGLYLTYQILVFQLQLDLTLDSKIEERLNCTRTCTESLPGHTEL